MLTVPIHALTGPLLLRRHGRAVDFGIFIQLGGRRLSVGRIMAVQHATGSDRGSWLWTITGPAVPNSADSLSGDAGSLTEARTALREAFERLLKWASSTHSAAMPWHVGAERIARLADLRVQ